MATITKVPRKHGHAWKAIIKHRGKVLKSKTFPTKTLARAWAKRIESDVQAMEALGERGSRLTLKELAKVYLDEGWQGKDRRRDRQVNWWVERLGTYYINDIRPDQIREALHQYRQGHAYHGNGFDTHGKPTIAKTGRQRAPASANRLKAALSAMYQYAHRMGWTSKNPARQVAIEPENNKRVRYLSDEERARLLKACRESTWEKLYLLVLMALMTGARRGELKALRWEHIDFQTRQATLDNTKNGDQRILTLPHPIIQELMRFRQPQGLVFASTLKPHRAFEHTKPWQTALAEAGIDNFRFHDLRHSAASYLAMGGATLLEIAEVLGHRNLQTTKRYAHLSVQHKQALTDRLLGHLQES